MSDAQNLRGCTVIATSASSGIGAVTARALYAADAHPVPSALANLPVLRKTTRQAAITSQEPSSSARTPAATPPGPISPTSPYATPSTGMGSDMADRQ